MESFFIVLVCFLVSFILHVAAHRMIRARSITAYLAGAVVLYVFGRLGYITLPWSSGALYTLLSATAILFYFAISLGTETPSSIILESFKRKKQQTFKDLTALFTDRGLIYERIDDLILSRLVKHHAGGFALTGWGNVIWWIMETYRWVFHRSNTE